MDLFYHTPNSRLRRRRRRDKAQATCSIFFVGAIERQSMQMHI